MQPHGACANLTLIQALACQGQSPAGGLGAVVAPRFLLGAVCYGGHSLLDSQRSALADRNLAIQYVATPPLGAEGGDGPACLWHLLCTDRPAEHGHAGRIRFGADGAFVFGVLDLPRVRSGEGGLRRGAKGVYEEIFSFLGALDPGKPYRLWRAWNYVSDIHAEEDGLERYRQFNIGRLDAFTEYWAARSGAGPASNVSTEDIPAACGVGMIGSSSGIDLTVAFLASRAMFSQIENPRQISAFHYPADYGPSSPTFSRAVMGAAGTWPGQGLPQLFISGTGSIVGHRSMHVGNVAMQARESLRNVEALLQQANGRQASAGRPLLAMSQLQYLVYLRRPRDLPAVQAVLAEVLGSGAKVRVVHAEICRSDLLIEIEASLLCDQAAA